MHRSGFSVVGALALIGATVCAHQGARTAQPSPGQIGVQTIAVPQGGRLYVESKGHGKPVILIHGGQLDRRMWDRELDSLALHYHVVLNMPVQVLRAIRDFLAREN